ncbi:MAG: hypothetical protein KA314_13515 [Chloroflexi bacterium]|nr:hypothetical protein [Chloroflexota bacterium]
MPDTTISVTLTGSAVNRGTIELRRLVQFGERLQKAIDRVAYSIEKQSGSRRKFGEVRQDTSLRLLETKAGSFVAEMEFIRAPVLFEGFYDIATDAAKKLVAGLDLLRNSENGDLPEGYDQGVLIVLQDLGRILHSGIEQMEFDVVASQDRVTATYDNYTYLKISEVISEPEEKIAAISGHLLMANFGRDRYRCHLYYEDDKYISCTFDEDVIEDIDNAMRHQVNAVGIATINPVDDEIMGFHIKQITILDEEVSPQQLTDVLDSYIADNDTLASFRRSWEEALDENVKPISELWNDIDDVE